ncbi:NAD-dependent epimerase/dehydratase family protein [Egicoccus sp. AB-alg2]|uniref:NAD-dependent epimerase/dehydratase family protein n=1 Tax=Egicoccus sp. AB-alg2 TaxID=3242693 RepID=UPI00359D98D5
MRITVTGGAGFIGANLVRRLVAASDVEVSVLDDLSSGRRAYLEELPRTRLVVGDVRDEAALDEVVAGADAVVHLAARVSVPESVADPVDTHEVNATGTLRVFEAARRHGDLHVVWPSSAAVYGSPTTMPVSEELPPAPASPYAASKLAGEGLARSHASSYGLPVLTFRFFNVFGPLQPADHAYAAVVPAFVDAALAGRPLTIYGDGEQTRDFISVHALTGVLETALRRRLVHIGPVNLAFGTRRSINELAGLLEEHFGPLPVEHREERPGDVRHSQADNRLLRALVPDLPQDDFPAALADTVRWFRAQHDDVAQLTPGPS